MTMITHPFLLPAPRRDSILDSYLSYVADDGLDLERFVEQGSHLLVPDDLRSLRMGLPDLLEKAQAMRAEAPRLARQVELLASFFQAVETRQPAFVSDDAVRETAFALIYTARDMDLMPDDLPGVGLTDDAAVVEIVMERHAEVFFHHCRSRGIVWAEVRPNSPFRS